MGFWNKFRTFFTAVEYEINNEYEFNNAVKLIKNQIRYAKEHACPTSEKYEALLPSLCLLENSITEISREADSYASQCSEISPSINSVLKQQDMVNSIYSALEKFTSRNRKDIAHIKSDISAIDRSSYESVKNGSEKVMWQINSTLSDIEKIETDSSIVIDASVYSGCSSINQSLDLLSANTSDLKNKKEILIQKSRKFSASVKSFMKEAKTEKNILASYLSNNCKLNKQYDILDHCDKDDSFSSEWASIKQEKQLCDSYLSDQISKCDNYYLLLKSLDKRIANNEACLKKLRIESDEFQLLIKKFFSFNDLLLSVDKQKDWIRTKKSTWLSELEADDKALDSLLNDSQKKADRELKYFTDLYTALPDPGTPVYLNWKSVQDMEPSFNDIKSIYAAPYCAQLKSSPMITDTFRTAATLKDYTDQCNKEFISRQMISLESFFSDFNGKSPDRQQCEAVLTDEDYTQVIAGAGSGKTFTILVKIKYLIEILHADPKKILLLSFNKATAKELEEQINNQMGYPVTIKTFHSCGYDIVSQCKTGIGVYSDDDSKKLGGILEQLIKSRSTQDDFAQKLLDFSILYQVEPKSRYEFESLNAYCSALGQIGTTTLKKAFELTPSSKDDACELYNDKNTFDGNHVRSYEEWVIANYLFLNGISYEYEKPFPQEFQDEYYKRPYKPDFYLTDYNLYWEHFGIDAAGQAGFLSGNEKKKYENMVEVKRKLFADNHLPLLETTSNDFTGGHIYEKLDRLFIRHGIEKKPMCAKDVVAAISENKKCQIFNQSVSLLTNYLNLYKSNCYGSKDIETAQKRVVCSNDFDIKRTDLFFSLFEKLIAEYEVLLESMHKIDFNDMISESINLLNSGKYIMDLDYVIVDEFQDISFSRFQLLKSIVSQNKRTKLFCVGDDWQSIYRFTGSDLNFFVDFDSYWPHAKRLRIEHTYRNSQELIDVASGFIMKNNRQVSKKLHSSKHLELPVYIIEYNDTCQDGNQEALALQYAVNYLAKAYERDHDLMILSRNNQGLKDARKDLRANYQYTTVHRSKGLEASVAILTNVVDHYNGFPNQMTDDSLLKSLLAQPEPYPYAEERRLFYVALTRTKGKIVIITPTNHKSSFIAELQSEGNVETYILPVKDFNIIENRTCPICKGNTLLIRENKATHEHFVGCGNYPICQYTRSLSRDEQLVMVPPAL